MMCRFVSANVGQIADETHVVIVEPGHARWEEFLAAGPVAWAEPEPTPEPVPQVISRFQARAALLRADLLSAVEAAVGSADALTQLAWAEATEWRRDSPTIVSLGSAIGLGESDIDELFIAASSVTA